MTSATASIPELHRTYSGKRCRYGGKEWTIRKIYAGRDEFKGDTRALLTRPRTVGQKTYPQGTEIRVNFFDIVEIL